MNHAKTIEIQKKLVRVNGISGPDVTTLNYAVHKNKSRLKEPIGVLVKMEDEINSITKNYQDERTKKLVALSDNKLKQVGEQTMYDVPESKIPELKRFDVKLKEKYKSDFEKQQKALEEYQKFLIEKESDFEIYSVKFADLPKNISDETMELIFDIIE